MTQLSITIPITKRRKVVLTVEEAREVQRQLNEIFPETKKVPLEWTGPAPAWPAQPAPNWPIGPDDCKTTSATPLPPQPTTTCDEPTNSRSDQLKPKPHEWLPYATKPGIWRWSGSTMAADYEHSIVRVYNMMGSSQLYASHPEYGHMIVNALGLHGYWSFVGDL